MRWKKYLAGFRLALSNELIYRANFLFGRLRELIVFGALLYLFSALPNGIGGYDQSRLLTYALGASFISALLFVYGMNTMASEIADGDLTNYLLRPVHYFGFWTARLFASRSLLLIAGIFQVMILLFFVRHQTVFWQKDIGAIFRAAILLLGALAIVQLFDFLAATLSFWTYRSYGPRWLVTILLQFFSGAYLAIDLFPSWVQRLLSLTPFPWLVYMPLKVYLGNASPVMFVQAIITQTFWIAALILILSWLWRRGVKSYEAYGR